MKEHMQVSYQGIRWEMVTGLRVDGVGLGFNSGWVENRSPISRRYSLRLDLLFWWVAVSWYSAAQGKLRAVKRMLGARER